MDTQRLSAILLIAGSAVMILAFPIGLSGVYQIQDLDERVRIIEEHKSRWYVSQSLIAISALLTAFGFAVLASNLRTLGSAWIPIVGAAALVIAAISAEIFIYRQTIDPLSTYQGAYSGMQMLYYWLSVPGFLLFGVAFLQAGLPAWLGYVTTGASLVFGIFMLVSGAGFLTPGLVVILSLVIGIAVLRQ
ncbi:MAG: hypothetical protein ACE5JF_11315 [Anaerolineales bacterium]